MIPTPYEFEFCNERVIFESNPIQPREIPAKKMFPIRAIALDISGECNMHCIYCAERATLPPRLPMSKETLRQVITTVFHWFPKDVKVSIHLGSGEPLLQPDLVHEIGVQAQKLAKINQNTLELFLTTNGTLLNETICNWLVADGWHVKISLDGNAQIHNHNRGPETYAIIEKYVRFFAKTLPEKFSTTSVLCHGTDPSEVFNSIASLGVKRIEIVPVVAESPSPFLLQKDDITNYRTFISNYVKRIAKGEKVPVLIGFIKKLQRVMGLGNSRISCGAGRNFFTIAADKAIYPCFRFVGLEKFQLGHLHDGLNEKLTFQFQTDTGKPYNLYETCTTCWAAPICGGPCFASAWLLSQEIGEAPVSYCEQIKADSEAAIWLHQKLYKKNPEKLVNLLGISIDEY
jgi:uncharacterized protein